MKHENTGKRERRERHEKRDKRRERKEKDGDTGTPRVHGGREHGRGKKSEEHRYIAAQTRPRHICKLKLQSVPLTRHSALCNSFTLVTR